MADYEHASGYEGASYQKMKVSGGFSFQFNESTGVAKCDQLLSYDRVSGTDDLEDYFLSCKPLKTMTRAIDIFNLVNTFLLDYGIEWSKCFHNCCYGAPSMIGARKGFVCKDKKKNLAFLIALCLLHREKYL